MENEEQAAPAGASSVAEERAAGGTEQEKSVWREMATVEDPELGFSVVDMGLVYDLKIDEAGVAFITMTFTSMACPVGPQLKGSVEAAARRAEGIKDAEAEVVFSPPWDPKEMATEEIQEMMGIY